MKTILLAATALFAAAPAAAQDAPAPTPQPIAAGGLYAGAHLGVGFSKPGYSEPDYPDYNRNPDLQGVVGGVLVGYDVPMSWGSAGVEADFGLMDANKHADEDATFNDYTAFDMKWNAHLRARAGTNVGGARMFVAGGLALAKLKVDDVDSGWGDFTKTYSGWTLGAGVEKQLMGNATLRIEYLHDEFGRKSGEQTYTDGSSSYDVRVKPDSDIVRFAGTFAF